MIWVYSYLIMGWAVGFSVVRHRWPNMVAAMAARNGNRPPSRSEEMMAAIGGLIVFTVAWLPMFLVALRRVIADRGGRTRR